jgi:hypothetical protein
MTTGLTHSLSTVAGQVVVVKVKGAFGNTTNPQTVSLRYAGTVRDSIPVRNHNVSDRSGFSLLWVGTPGTATADIVAEVDGGNLYDVVITVIKIGG